MDEDRAGTVREWNSRSIEGHAGLRRLAGEEFSGVIETDRGAIRAYMTNGRIVLIDRGGIDDLDGMSMTAYSAPDDAVPLLFAMQERGGDPRAQYYTEDTPLSEVNRTLEEAGFTGYVELSENVLSGDYYVVYHGGRSSSVAFVGSSSRLLTGQEAFERADDEVGIYEVIDVDVSVIDVPGADGSDATTGGGATAGTEPETTTPAPSGDADPDTAADPADADAPAESVDPGSSAGADGASAGAGPATDDSRSSAGSGGDSADSGRRSADLGARTTDRSAPGGSGPSVSGEEIRVGAGLGTDEDGDADDGGDADASSGRSDDTRAGAAGEVPGTAGGDAHDGPAAPDHPDDAGPAAPADDGSRTAERPSDAEAGDRPAEPDDGAGAEAGGTAGGRDAAADAGAAEDPAAGAADAAEQSEGEHDGSRDRSGTAPEPAGDDAGDGGSEPAPSSGAGRQADAADADAGGEETGGGVSGPTRDRLAAELGEAREALERVRSERDDYRDDAERLRERVSTLESRIEALESESESESESEDGTGETDADGDGSGTGTADAPERTLPPREALQGTNLFVRYRSKAEPTLEAAHGGDVDPTAVNRNIRIEQHTRFESAGLTVAGEPFDSYLTSTFEYQFVEWVIRDLLYELRSTGSRAAMEQLYDAIPAIDRVEFEGEVQIGDGGAADDGDDAADARRFDVIFRDRMGGPLLVANLHESRDPTRAPAVTTLIEDARTVAVSVETIGAAFVVTTSYYEPQALEAASSATGGGFLSRSRKESFVKMDRKRGFHLCLLEARDGEFNLRIPEL